MSKGERANRDVANFNAKYSIGTPVRYWPLIGGKESRLSTTRSYAKVLEGHTAVVWVEGKADFVALDHIEVVPAPGDAATGEE